MFQWSQLRFARVRSRFTRVVSTKRVENSVPGTITLDRRSYPCRLYGVSATSAMLEIDQPMPPDLPTHFFLRPNVDRTHRRVRLIWQHGRQAGVEFITRWSIPW